MQHVKEWESILNAVMVLTLNNDYLVLAASLQILRAISPTKVLHLPLVFTSEHSSNF